MPELPEVETVVRSLRPHLEKKLLSDCKTPWPKVLDNLSLAQLNSNIRRNKILKLSRIAKYIVIELEKGYLLAHLRMTGMLYPVDEQPAGKKHISAYFKLDSGKYLVFQDQRKFGRIYYYQDSAALREFSERFGPEPLGPDFSSDWLKENLQKHKRLMKPLLLDQSFIAGLGNIYVDEALWEAKIHPLELSGNVPTRKITRLHVAIQTVLNESIEANGTTFMDFKFLGGRKGGYTDNLRVFSRQGEPCPRCNHIITKLKVAQRGTHICEKCQTPP